MKRAIITSILGVAASLSLASKVDAQGYVVFCNYNGGLVSTAPVTYGDGPNAGLTVGSEFTAELLYSFGADLGTQTYTSVGTTAFVGNDGDAVDAGGGLFGATSLSATIPNYTPSSGPIDFIIRVYNGSSYSDASTTYAGQSAVIQLASLAALGSPTPEGGFFSDNPNIITPMQGFTVTQTVPEPGTLALAGLSGFGMLMALRRKKA